MVWLRQAWVEILGWCLCDLIQVIGSFSDSVFLFIKQDGSVDVNAHFTELV